MKTKVYETSIRQLAKRDLLWMILSGSSCFVINTLIMLTPLQTEIKSSYMDLNPLWILVYVSIVAPLVEEFLCRYCLYNGVKQIFRKIKPESVKLATILAALISTIFFALMHGSVAQIIYAAIMGLLFCIAYETESNIGIPILMHFTANVLCFTLSKYVTEFIPAYIIIDPILIACIIVTSMILIKDTITVTGTTQR